MSLKERLLEDMKSAMKNGETLRKTTISMARAAILQVEKDRRVQLDDDEIIAVLAKELKQRKDALPEFEKANRPNLVENLQQEISILQDYLPEPLSEDELDQMVTQAIFEVGANTMKDMGRVMTALMPRLRGRADGNLVNSLVKKHLKGY